MAYTYKHEFSWSDMETKGRMFDCDYEMDAEEAVKALIAKDERIAELELKSCTLDLTKGHLSQCEAALEARDQRIEDLEEEIKIMAYCRS
jgi:hypothetical protein